MQEIYLVTSNKGKVCSFKNNFSDDNVIVNWVKLDIEEPYINDIEKIADFKVMNAYKTINKPCVSIDAGFYVKNFPDNPNFPGAFPKRDLIEKIGIKGLLEKMKNVNDRECFFKECLAYYDGNTLKHFYGMSEGVLSHERIGDDNKKWSDLWSVFIPLNCSKTMAQMTDEERKTRPDGHTSCVKEFTKWYHYNKRY